MGLGFHENLLNAMKAVLEKGIGKVRIEHGNWADAFSAFMVSYFAGEKLTNNSKKMEWLFDYVGDLPFVDFVGETLRRDVMDALPYEKDKSTTIEEVGLFGDSAAIAQSLVDRFNTLPWSYNFTIKLPEIMFMQGLVPGSMSDKGASVRLVESDLFLEQNFPLTHPNELVASKAKSKLNLLNILADRTEWSNGSVFFQMEVEGFVGVYGATPTVGSVENLLESFVGLGLANRIFSYNYKYDNASFNSQWIVHKKSEQGWVFDSRFDANESTREVLRQIKCFNFNNDYPVDQRSEWIKRRLLIIYRCLVENECRSILLSAKWLFDSYKKADDSLSFVRLMTSIEILLCERMDSSRMSIGETIGNRLAFLIGKNRKDRNEILQYFKNLYQIRSKILHNGKHRLVGQEKQQLYTLRDYVIRALYAECEALARE